MYLTTAKEPDPLQQSRLWMGKALRLLKHSKEHKDQIAGTMSLSIAITDTHIVTHLEWVNKAGVICAKTLKEER